MRGVRRSSGGHAALTNKDREVLLGRESTVLNRDGFDDDAVMAGVRFKRAVHLPRPANADHQTRGLEHAARLPVAFAFSVLDRTLAETLSIAFVVLMCRLCSAGKSRNASRLSRTFAWHSVAAGCFAEEDSTTRSKPFSPSARVGGIHAWCGRAFAPPCSRFGSLRSAFRVRCTQPRCPRALQSLYSSSHDFFNRVTALAERPGVSMPRGHEAVAHHMAAALLIDHARVIVDPVGDLGLSLEKERMLGELAIRLAGGIDATPIQALQAELRGALEREAGADGVESLNRPLR
jgi:hypothetical protein